MLNFSPGKRQGGIGAYPEPLGPLERGSSRRRVQKVGSIVQNREVVLSFPEDRGTDRVVL